MPTYTYECQACGHRYDAFQSMKDDPHTVCPECKGRVERLIGAGAGIVFKGSGFYVTDYRKNGGGSSAGSSSTGSSKSGEGTSTGNATATGSTPATSTGGGASTGSAASSGSGAPA